MSFQIHFTHQSADDLEDISSFIAQDDPERADTFIDEIIDFIKNQLSEFPKSGPVNENDIRRTVFNKTILIYYIIKDDLKQVDILYIKHHAKPLEKF